jgi:hypothetical protein
MAFLSINSMAAGIILALITAVDAFTACATEANGTSSETSSGGLGIRLKVISVTIASVPSEPQISWIRS